MLLKIGVFSGFLFVTLLSVYLYSPVIRSFASESNLEADVNLEVEPTISLTTSVSSLEVDTEINSFAHDSIDAYVVTNSPYGYVLSIEDADSDTSMHHSLDTITDEITSDFSGTKTAETMAVNEWGWSVDGVNYRSMSEAGSPIVVRRGNRITNQGYETTTVDFGFKTGMDTIPGTYTDTVKFTAYANKVIGTASGANPKEYGKEYLQEFNCSTLQEGDILTLTDIRDGNDYPVEKMPDGKCWILENLRLGSTRLLEELTTANTNMSPNVDFTLPASSDITATYGVPMINTSKVSDTPTRFGTIGSGKAGVYYNYCAATAGTICEEVSPQAAQYDICPAGFRMPAGGSNSSGAFYVLRQKYASDAEFLSAFAVVLNGWYDSNNVVIANYGYFSYLWSSSAYNQTNKARGLGYVNSKLNFNYGILETNGFGLRCVAKTK